MCNFFMIFVFQGSRLRSCIILVAPTETHGFFWRRCRLLVFGFFYTGSVSKGPKTCGSGSQALN